MSEASKTIQLPSNESAITLAGDKEENLKTLSRQTGATLVLRGQELVISGTEKQVNVSHPWCDR
jgi:phosphate starvation-inducible PhoH-like protein